MSNRKATLLRADRESMDYLSIRASTEDDQSCDLSFRCDGPEASSGKVALISHEGMVHFIAGLEGSRPADDIRRTCHLTNIHRLPNPVHLDQLSARLRAQQRAPLNRGGTFTEKATPEVLGVVVDLNPTLGALIEFLLATQEINLSSNRRELVAQERDACSTLLAFSGLQIQSGLIGDEEVGDLASRSTFLPQMQSGTPLEDPMIEHDSNTFLGWQPQPTDKLGVRSYSDGSGRMLSIMNVNRWAIETNLGPDLLYYHIQRRSFVLVQYKRMVPEGKNWRYRVDDKFRKQLELMRNLDDRCRAIEEGRRFRLVNTPSFVKICRLDNLDIESSSMVSGMCMPREQVALHVAQQDKAPVFDYDSINDYMTSTLFADLVANGYLGTDGNSSDLVKHEIDRSLNRTGSVVVGALSDSSGRRQGGRRSDAHVVASTSSRAPKSRSGESDLVLF